MPKLLILFLTIDLLPILQVCSIETTTNGNLSTTSSNDLNTTISGNLTDTNEEPMKGG